jgi:hypothetical protein
VIVEAKITVIDERTKQTQTTTTSAEGKFRLPSLEPGSYMLTILSPGFIMFRKADLKLGSNEEIQIEVTLQVGTTGGAALLP